MEITILHITMLICSGLIVGFINTLAGGASSISLNVFLYLGLDPLQATIANRIPVLFQTLTSSVVYYKNKMLDINKGLRLSVPVVLGGIIGSLIAIEVDRQWFSYALGVMLLIVVFFLFYKPDKWINGKQSATLNSFNISTWLLFFAMGVYAGFIYIGMGYFLIIALVLLIGYDLAKANAMKNMIVLTYTPLLMIVFFIKGEFTIPMLVFGGIHAIGNAIGAWFATKIAIKKGVKFIRYIMIIVSIITALQVFGILRIY